MMLVRLTAVAALILVGCSKQSEPTAVPAEVKGEPIRGEPIRAAVVEATPVTNSAAMAATTNVAATEVKAPKPTDPGYNEVSFDLLANYTFEVPEGVISTNEVGKSNEQIPADVRALNQKKVALTGYMLPLKVDDGRVTEMLIMKDQSMCCYGSTPRINDWVSVKMKGDGVKSIMDQPVKVFGTLKVGEMLENGYLIGIYEMAGEKLEEVQ